MEAESSPSVSESPSPASETSETPATEKPVSEMTPAEKRLFKIKTKIDGVEEEKEYDEDQAKILIQKGLAADKRFQESAQMRKENETFRQQLKDKYALRQLLQEVGHNPRALAEELLAEELEFQMMSPEKKRIYELEREKFFREKSDKERKAQEESRKEQETRERLTGQLQSEVIETLKSSNLPQTPAMVHRIAQQMKIHLQKGIDIPAAEAARLVEKELIAENRSILSKLPPSKVEEILGPELANAILKNSLSKVKDPVQRGPRKVTDTIHQRTAVQKDRGYVTQGEFEKHMAAIRGKK